MASSKRSSSFSSLPLELIEEIFYRTPAESLIRSKATCKQWYALITDKRFIYNHLDRSPERFLRTVETVQMMDPVTGTRSDSPKEFNPSDTMVHCDGLMLCVVLDSRDPKLALWNPVLRKVKWIDPSCCFTEFDYYGIGYNINKSRDGYKILRFSDRLYDSVDQDCYSVPEVDLYECRTDSWKTLNANVDWDVDISCNGVAVMGNMYWLAQKKRNDYILGFDFSVETFKDICITPPLLHNNYLGCFNRDRLSLLQQDSESRQIQVWVSTKLAHGSVSFSRYFSVSSPDLPELTFDMETAHPVYCFVKPKGIITWCEGVVEEGDNFCLTLYEIDEGGLRKQLQTQRDCQHYHPSFLCGYVYVPSLIPLPC